MAFACGYACVLFQVMRVSPCAQFIQQFVEEHIQQKTPVENITLQAWIVHAKRSANHLDFRDNTEDEANLDMTALKDILKVGGT